MKNSISKFITIFTIFSICPNGFADNFFKYNSQRKLILPSSNVDYKSLSSNERNRLINLLKDNSIKEAIGEKVVDKFSQEAHSYDGIFGWRNQYKDAVHSSMKGIIGKLKQLQNNPKKAAIFYKSRSNHKFNFDGQMDPAGMPEFCVAYPQIMKKDIAAFYKGDKRVDKDSAYSGCYGEKSISVPVKKLVTNFAEINDSMMRKKEQKAREQLMILVANAMLDQRQKYQGHYNTYPKFDPELKNCLKKKSSIAKGSRYSFNARFPGLKIVLDRINSEEHNITEQDSNSKINPHFNNKNVEQAIIARNHFDKRNSLKQVYEQLKVHTRNSCLHTRNESLKNCFSRMDKIINKAKSIKIEIGKQEAALRLLMSETPALFKIENIDKYSPEVEIQIKPSYYMSSIMRAHGAKQLTSELDKEILNIPKGKTYKEVRANAITELREKHSAEINALSAKVKNYKKNDSDTVNKQITMIDESLKAICENEGKYLGRYSSMYPIALNEVANNASSKEEAVKNIEDIQAGLCSLYRKNSPNEDRQASPAQIIIDRGLTLGGMNLGTSKF